MTAQATPAEGGIENKYRGDARGNGRCDDLGREFNSPRLHQDFYIASQPLSPRERGRGEGWVMRDPAEAMSFVSQRDRRVRDATKPNEPISDYP